MTALEAAQMKTHEKSSKIVAGYPSPQEIREHYKRCALGHATDLERYDFDDRIRHKSIILSHAQKKYMKERVIEREMHDNRRYKEMLDEQQMTLSDHEGRYRPLWVDLGAVPLVKRAPLHWTQVEAPVGGMRLGGMWRARAD